VLKGEAAQFVLRVVNQRGVVDAAVGQKRGEPRRDHAQLHHRRPGQLSGLQLQAQVELHSLAQPARFDPGPADRGVRARLVLAAGDALVQAQRPHVVAPPLVIRVLPQQPHQHAAQRDLRAEAVRYRRQPAVIGMEQP
jgi:hypothetical protein